MAIEITHIRLGTGKKITEKESRNLCEFQYDPFQEYYWRDIRDPKFYKPQYRVATRNFTYEGHFPQLPKDYAPLPETYMPLIKRCQCKVIRVCTYGEDPLKLVKIIDNKPEISPQLAVHKDDIYNLKTIPHSEISAKRTIHIDRWDFNQKTDLFFQYLEDKQIGVFLDCAWLEIYEAYLLEMPQELLKTIGRVKITTPISPEPHVADYREENCAGIKVLKGYENHYVYATDPEAVLATNLNTTINRVIRLGNTGYYFLETEGVRFSEVNWDIPADIVTRADYPKYVNENGNYEPQYRWWQANGINGMTLSKTFISHKHKLITIAGNDAENYPLLTKQQLNKYIIPEENIYEVHKGSEVYKAYISQNGVPLESLPKKVKKAVEKTKFKYDCTQPWKYLPSERKRYSELMEKAVAGEYSYIDPTDSNNLLTNFGKLGLLMFCFQPIRNENSLKTNIRSARTYLNELFKNCGAEMLCGTLFLPSKLCTLSGILTVIQDLPKNKPKWYPLLAREYLTSIAKGIVDLDLTELKKSILLVEMGQ